jgi:hypothetical protein
MNGRPPEATNLDVTDAVEAFRQLLCCSWAAVARVVENDTSGSLLIDWMQANWEMLVEASIPPELGVRLEVYGDGADCNGSSSRVWQPSASPNAAVFARYIGNEPLLDALTGSEVSGDLKLDSFASMASGWPTPEAPFDFVVVDGGPAVPAANMQYYVRRLP